ncbi:MAG: NADH-quinone oxidoreductase subunit N [Wenzhouxiangellaceae bacterium]|nr:NADH-quinone oxidoreductase subunit N [Wenzhouxiangellaceae bacterium]
MPIADLLPELVLLAGAVFIILFASFSSHKYQPVCAGLALLAIGIAIVLAIMQGGKPPRLTFFDVWALDTMAIYAKLLILASGAFTVVLSPRWMATDRRHGEYYALVLFCLLGSIMMASATDSMELIVGVLLSSVTGYPLAAFHRAWAPSLEAGMKYFLIGALANALLVIGIVLMFGLTGATGYPDIERELERHADPVIIITALAFVVAGLSFKLGAFPAHAWLPDVAQGAPAPAAALLTVVPKIGAAIALTRFVQLLPDQLEWAWVVAAFSALTMTLGNLAALWQQDLRRLLGWSAVSQSGYALMAIAVVDSSDQAIPSLLVFLAAYATAGFAVFAAVIYLRGRTALQHYRGLARVRPWTAIAIILALLSFVGIPPLAGFFGKFLLFRATLDGGYAWLVIVALANTVLSLFYYLRVIAPMVFDQPPASISNLGRRTALAMLAATVLVVALGIWVQKLIEFAVR